MCISRQLLEGVASLAGQRQACLFFVLALLHNISTYMLIAVAFFSMT